MLDTAHNMCQQCFALCLKTLCPGPASLREALRACRGKTDNSEISDFLKHWRSEGREEGSQVGTANPKGQADVTEI